MDEAGLVVIPMPTDDALDRPEAMARLRALPGVRGVVALGGTPFGIDISSHASSDAATTGSSTSSSMRVPSRTRRAARFWCCR